LRSTDHREARSIANVYAKLAASGFELRWESAPPASDAAAKRTSKTKFTCPDCGQNAWAKADALLVCGACYEDDGAITMMLGE
jgi:hypothetical protein